MVKERAGASPRGGFGLQTQKRPQKRPAPGKNEKKKGWLQLPSYRDAYVCIFKPSTFDMISSPIFLSLFSSSFFGHLLVVYVISDEGAGMGDPACKWLRSLYIVPCAANEHRQHRWIFCMVHGGLGGVAAHRKNISMLNDKCGGPI